ncbi:MAG TPA: alpha-hydroxy acid oxidase [Acidimicrobiia bacterium]|nr:alpha-hydroxy acid oxidase [Acidimicrobiia bacterium]
MDAVALEARARELLDRAAFEYYAGGADDEVTLRDNVEAWHRARLMPRVLRDVTSVSPATELLGSQLAAPLLIAPMAFQRMAHPDGEIAMAHAAAAAGIPMVVSTMSTTTLEDIASAVPDGVRWFQFYVHKDRGLSERLVQRAVASGCSAVVLTLDVPVVGRRRRDEVNRFGLPDHLTVANLEESLESAGGSALSEYSDHAFEQALTPSLLEWIAGLTDLPLLVKGVLHPDDAVAAVDAGAAGVIVSNHGGRQLDGAIATADALAPIADAIGHRVPVLVDGGLRGGSDILKALALGADAVLIGRPALWGLTIGGADGAEGVMRELIEELVRAMTLCGVASPGEIDRSLIATP